MKAIPKILFPADLESSHLIDQRIDEGDSHLLIDHSTNSGTYVDGVKVIENVLLTEAT